MILLRDQFSQAYRSIVKDACTYQTPVIILPAPDCDSVCAVQILTNLLKMDGVPYNLKPVGSYEELQNAFQTLFKNTTDIQIVCMINCGATVHLQSFLELKENLRIFIIDSHRPYHLGNVSDENTQVWIFDDSDTRQSYPREEELYSSDEEETEGLEDEGENHPSKRQRKSLSDQAEKYVHKEEIKQKIEAYYRGSYYGTSASILSYNLCQQLSRDDNDMLWCAIVGLTDQYVHSRINPVKYDDEVLELKEEVLQKNLVEDSPNVDSGEASIAMYSMKVGAITFQPNEFSFFLYRHWTLSESIYHTPYVSARLGVWSEPGRRKLLTFFARMGIPLKEAKSSYSVMSIDYRESLHDKLEEYSEEFDLNPDFLMCGSFHRCCELDLTISALDAVHAVSTLLEVTSPDQDSMIAESGFWRAFDCINRRTSHSLREGIRLSIELQKSIVTHASSVLVQRKIICTGPFRYAILDHVPGHSSLFQPLSLIKLAHLIMDSYQVQKRRADKPFVLCSLNSVRQTYVVVGIPSPQTLKDVYRNTFGQSFAEAAAQSQARIKHDGFEEFIIEVQKEDITNFLHVLLLLM